MLNDQYFTIHSTTFGEYKEKGSKFLAYCHPFSREDDLQVILALIKSEHPKASHYCFAYKIGLDNNRFRSNDDGEPSGTAGKPILGQILSNNLTDILIVVVRYFGGTKLGASGLIHAYRQAAIEGLSNASVIEKFKTTKYVLTFTYEHMGSILASLKTNQINILEKSFDNQCFVKIEIRNSEATKKIILLKSHLLGVSLDQVSEDTVVEFCRIKKLLE
ncbi:MAG: YigZ family protein [Saprospiraceae bacterium]|jgi:uncharacterized YigZ family protein|nr:YigZ family protein [Saprospiraceae bacterium]